MIVKLCLIVITIVTAGILWNTGTESFVVGTLTNGWFIGIQFIALIMAGLGGYLLNDITKY